MQRGIATDRKKAWAHRNNITLAEGHIIDYTACSHNPSEIYKKAVLDLDNIPRFIKILKSSRNFSTMGGNITYCYATDISEATHVFLQLDLSQQRSYETNINYFGVVTRGVYLNCRQQASVFYMDINQNCVLINQMRNFMFSSMINQEQIVFNDEPVNRDNMFYGLEDEDYAFSKDPTRLWSDARIETFLKQLKYPCMSAEYHQFLKPLEVWKILTPEEKAKARRCFNMHPDIGAAGFAGCMLWLAGAPQDVYELLYQSKLWRAQSISEFTEIGKAISNKAKACQNIVPIDLRAIFEIMVLINRVHTPVDWEKEKEHRVRPNICTISKDFVYKEAIAALTLGKADARRYYKKTNWDDFWKNRFEWMSAGSFNSQYVEDEKWLDHRMDYKNKFIHALAMPSNTPFNYFLARDPSIHAKTSIKYEWGKERAIYGCDLTSFVMTEFAMQGCEDQLCKVFPIGKNSKDHIVRGRIDAILRNRVPFCLDYEDFNSQHSTESMQAVLEAYYDVYHDAMSEEQKDAMCWVIESITSVTIRDGIGKQGLYKAKGTLMSGWRLTSWMNSLLNYIYMKAIADNAYTYHKSVHSGDDTLYGVFNYRQVRDIYGKAARLNIRLSRGKCNFGSVAEFLRIDHQDNSYGQYLPRSIATLVHARIESDPAYQILDVYEACMTRTLEVVRRGGDLDLMSRVLRLMCERYKQEWTDGAVEPLDYFVTSRVCGGSSECYGDERLELSLTTSKTVAEPSRPKFELVGIKDYVVQTCKKIPFELKFKKELFRTIEDKILSSYARVPSKVITKVTTPEERYKSKVLKGIRGIKGRRDLVFQYGKVRSIGLFIQLIKLIGENTTLLKIVYTEPEPLKILSKIL